MEIDAYDPQREEHYEYRNRVKQGKNIPMEVKQSKIKAIQEVKMWNGSHGLVYYHNLELENGDKINIGKKKELKVGYDVTYVITEHGQQEYQKSRAPKRDEIPQSMQQQTTQKIQESKQSKDDYVKGIEVGHAVNNAVNMLCAGLVFDDIDPELSLDNKVYFYAKHIMKISEKLKDE